MPSLPETYFTASGMQNGTHYRLSAIGLSHEQAMDRLRDRSGAYGLTGVTVSEVRTEFAHDPTLETLRALMTGLGHLTLQQRRHLDQVHASWERLCMASRDVVSAEQVEEKRQDYLRLLEEYGVGEVMEAAQ